jgi:hypothetical protein
MQKIMIIDFESSGLMRGSFPIEVAWASEDLQVSSYLIRPTEIWLEDSRLWDPAAECLHGISLEELFRHGKRVSEVANAMLMDLQGARVYSNNPLYDQDWLHRLLCAANCDQPFKIHHINNLLAEITDIEGINFAYHIANEITPPNHRAAQDVLNLWEVYRQCHQFVAESVAASKSRYKR